MARIYHTAHKRAKFRNKIRNLVTDLVLHERIKVTKKCKQPVKQILDKLINLAKKDNLHNYRQILKIVRINNKGPDKLTPLTKLKKLALKYKDRDSGYTKVYNLGLRRGDLANVYFLTLI